MTEHDTVATPSRRSIAKGAAWAVPAVTIAASAPSLAASPQPCEPETCVRPALSALQIIATRGPGNDPANITFTGAITAFVTECTGFFSLGVAFLRRVEVTWASRSVQFPFRGSIPATTTTAAANFDVELGINALGALIIPTAIINIPEVTNLQNGVYLGAAELGAFPSRPTSLCFDIDYTRIIGGGLPPQQCQARICIDTAIIAAVGTVTNTAGGLVTYTVADIAGA